jgi:hypothetical protein
MSHFMVVCVLPEGININVPANDPRFEFGPVHDHVASVMAPYDESLDVEEYEADCWCKQANLRKWIDEQMLEEFPGGIPHLRDTFKPISEEIHAKYPGIGDDDPGPWDAEKEVQYGLRESELQEAWTQHMAGFQKRYKELEKQGEAEGRAVPNPTCGYYTAESLTDHPVEGAKPGDRYEDGSGCEGTGKIKTTYNPDSKWDWYVVGGRWDGALAGLDEIDDGQGGFNFGDEFHTLERNMVKMSEASDGPPYAYITPDGEWHGQGEMGWFGVSRDALPFEDWINIWKQTREDYADHWAVAIDCHI